VEAKSNQKNLGTEIIEYSSPEETAVCILALPSFVANGKYAFDKLHGVTKVVANNFNRIISINFYPIPWACRPNMRHRPIGIGVHVQGLGDTFMAFARPFIHLRLAYSIFRSLKLFIIVCFKPVLAARDGTYKTYKGRPASQGQLEYNLWNVTPTYGTGFP